MGIEKQKMKQKEENVFKTSCQKKKRKQQKKQENREENENVTETNELVLSKNLMKKEKITRKEIRQEDVKTRGDRKKQMEFFEPLGIFLTLAGFDQTSFLFLKNFFFPDLR